MELHEKLTPRGAGDFLRALIQAVPYKVHTVLSDHAIPFTTPNNTASAAPLLKEALKRGEPVWAHARLRPERHQSPAHQAQAATAKSSG